MKYLPLDIMQTFNQSIKLLSNTCNLSRFPLGKHQFLYRSMNYCQVSNTGCYDQPLVSCVFSIQYYYFQTYTKCLDCILLFLPQIDRPADLSFMLQKHLCGIDWEAREATISFIQKVIVSYGKGMKTGFTFSFM